MEDTPRSHKTAYKLAYKADKDEFSSFCADAGGIIPGEELSGGRSHSNLATTLPCQSCVLVKPLEALTAEIFGEDLNHIQATT